MDIELDNALHSLKDLHLFEESVVGVRCKFCGVHSAVWEMKSRELPFIYPANPISKYIPVSEAKCEHSRKIVLTEEETT